MKYCLNYTEKNITKYLDKFNEITIRFRPSDSSLVDFMLQHLDQRINIFIADNKDFVENNRIKLFQAIKKEHPEINFVFKLQNCQEDGTLEVLKIITSTDEEFKYFFINQVRDFDTFWGIINLKPTDIYIVEDLGFYIKQCGDLAHSAGVSVRVFPNVAQSSWKRTPAIMKFFIRPEDIEIYEPYVDVIEFFGNEKKVDAYYDIYTKDNPKWFGKLNEVIIDFNDDVDSRCLLSNFAERRLSCGKRCLKGGKCQICAATQVLANTLSEKDIIIQQLENRRKKVAKQS